MSICLFGSRSQIYCSNQMSAIKIVPNVTAATLDTRIWISQPNPKSTRSVMILSSSVSNDDKLILLGSISSPPRASCKPRNSLVCIYRLVFGLLSIMSLSDVSSSSGAVMTSRRSVPLRVSVLLSGPLDNSNSLNDWHTFDLESGHANSSASPTTESMAESIADTIWGLEHSWPKSSKVCCLYWPIAQQDLWNLSLKSFTWSLRIASMRLIAVISLWINFWRLCCSIRNLISRVVVWIAKHVLH